MRGIAIIGAGLALVTVPALAHAQRVIVRDQPDQIFEVGGGITDFATGLDDETDPGAAWDARVIFGTRAPLGFELAYVGGLQDLNDTKSDLMLNGGEGMLRLNLSVEDIQPFLAGGVGVHNYSVVDVTEADLNVRSEAFNDSTDLAVPLAAGLQAYLGDSMTVGARVTYRYIFDDDIKVDSRAVDAQSWAATARLGMVF